MIEIDGKYFCEYCFKPMVPGEPDNHGCAPGTNTLRFPSALTEGDVLAGKYIIGRVIGKGGFGITYLCYDLINNCRVAIKEYFPSGLCHRNNGQKTIQLTDCKNEELLNKGIQRFYDEAKLISQFCGHPCIVGVKKFFKENGTVYIVMEYLQGMDLRKYLSLKGCPSQEEALNILSQILKSLKLIHSRNILHRDISPDNIFVCADGTIKLIDFGASRVASGEKALSIILKPGYAPMEQYQTKTKQGPWTDIYALGGTLYYMFTLIPPTDAISRYNGEQIDWTDVPPMFVDVIQKMMHPDINQRCKNVDEVISAIYSYTGINLANRMASSTISQQPRSAPQPVVQPAVRSENQLIVQSGNQPMQITQPRQSRAAKVWLIIAAVALGVTVNILMLILLILGM